MLILMIMMIKEIVHKNIYLVLYIKIIQNNSYCYKIILYLKKNLYKILYKIHKCILKNFIKIHKIKYYNINKNNKYIR